MKERFQIVVVTVAVFVAGLLIGVWTQHTPPLPPPPIQVMGEFGGRGGGMFNWEHGFPPPWLFPGPGAPRVSPEELRRRIAELQPQLDAFRGKVREIEKTFHSGFRAILRPDQKATLDSIIAEHKKYRAYRLPGCLDEIGRPFVSMIIYRPIYDRMSAELKLDDSQRAAFRKLLIERRNSLLALVDETPPPSLKLGAMLFRPPVPPMAQSPSASAD